MSRFRYRAAQPDQAAAGVRHGEDGGGEVDPAHAAHERGGDEADGVARDAAAEREECAAAFQAMRAEHVCMDWDGCTKNPVRYCISSQATYMPTTTHGWPNAGGQWIADFQNTLPK